MNIDRKEIDILINDCLDDKKSKLSEWEYDFVCDMEERLNKKMNFSEKQINLINKIWEKVT